MALVFEGINKFDPIAWSRCDLQFCSPLHLTDVLGFCYSAALPTPVELKSGRKYYIVSSETSGEAFVNMTMSVTGADYGTYRDGDTLMTYHLPTNAGAAVPLAAASSEDGSATTRSCRTSARI